MLPVSGSGVRRPPPRSLLGGPSTPYATRKTTVALHVGHGPVTVYQRPSSDRTTAKVSVVGTAGSCSRKSVGTWSGMDSSLRVVPVGTGYRRRSRFGGVFRGQREAEQR